MSIQEQLFTSFIKGIAKTTGSLTVLSIVAAVWHLYSNEEKRSPNDLENKDSLQEHIYESEQDSLNLNNDLDCSFVECNNDQSTATRYNFKKLFDKI